MTSIPEIPVASILDSTGGSGASHAFGEVQSQCSPTSSENLPHFSPTWPSLSRLGIGAQGWLKACYNSPPKCPLFHRWPDFKQVRSQRREAYLAVLLALLRHLDTTTLCIGFLHPNGQFQALAPKYIVMETGLGQRRYERVIVDLKKIQALEMKSPGHDQRPVLAFTARFIEWMLWESSLWDLEHSRTGDSQSAHDCDEDRP